MTTDTILRTPLYDTHVQQGGRMVDFAGWEMPVQFAGIQEEHHHTRNACSVFDVSHMGRLALTGKDCESLLDRLCTRNLQGAAVGRSYYGHICREDGGILDDVIISRFEKHWGIVCNASNREKIVRWINQHAENCDVKLRDDTLTTCMVACQGPKTLELMSEFTSEDMTKLKRYHFRTRQFGPFRIVVYRCGYTGEDGVEVVLPTSLVGMMIPKLFGTPKKPHPIIRPAGLGARDTLRIEAAMPLYGHELSEDWDPLSAGQGWCVDLTKDFVGADALRTLSEQGLPRQLIGLELEGRRIARPHAEVFAGGSPVGEVTSGTLSPTLGKSIAMAFVGREHTGEGAKLEVAVGSKRLPASVVPLPFYKRAR